MVGLSKGRGRGGRVLWPLQPSTSTCQTHPEAEHQTHITRSHNTPLQHSTLPQTSILDQRTITSQLPNQNTTLPQTQTLAQRTTRSHLPNQSLPGPDTRTPVAPRSHPPLRNPTLPQPDTLASMTTRSHPLSQTQFKYQSFTQRTKRSHSHPQTQTLAQTQCFSPQLNSYNPVEEHDSNSSPIPHEFEQSGSDRLEDVSVDDAERVVEESPDNIHTPEEESSGRHVRTRGLTRCLRNVTSETKKVIYLHNGRAVAGESDKDDQDFVSQVMVWAKHSSNIPLQVKDFKDIPKETLVRFWDFVQVQSERNSINISNSQSSHSVGTVSFQRLRNREEKETGVEPNPLEFYRKTHTKKDGTPVSEDAAQKMKQMDELKEQVSEGVCSYTDIEIFRISVGPDSRGRTKGHGRIPASEVYSTRRRTRAELERELEEQRKKYEEELSAVKNQVNDISTNLRGQMQLELREQMRLELREQMRLEMQEQMHAFMEKMRGGALFQPPTNELEDDNVNGEMRNNDGGTREDC